MNILKILFVLLPIFGARDGQAAYAALIANRKYAAWLEKQSVADQELLNAAGPLFLQGIVDSIL